jgi:basic membrane protein A
VGREGNDAGGDSVDRLIEMTRRQDELWQLLRDEQDETKRIALFDELTMNRADLARLRESVAQEVAEPVAARSEPTPAPVHEMPPPGRVFEPITRAGPRGPAAPTRSPVEGPVPPVPPSAAAAPPPPPVPSPEPTLDAAPPARSPVKGPAAAGPPVPPSSSEPEVIEAPAATAPAVPPESLEPPVATTSATTPGAPPLEPAPSIGEQLRASLFNAPAAPSHVETPSRRRPHDEATDSAVPTPTAAPAGGHGPAPPPSRPSPPHGGESTGYHLSYRDLERVRPHRRRSFPILAVLVALAAVAVVAWFLFLRDRGSASEEPETHPTTTLAAAEASAAAQIRAVLDGLGYTAISVENRSGTIFLTGPVGSENDRAAVIGASQALAGATGIDAGGVTIAVGDDEVRADALDALSAAGYQKVNVSVSGGVATVTGVSPESGIDGLVATLESVAGIDRVVDMTEATDRTAALQSELNRITAATPIVFASGQTGLNVLQERILDSITEIITAYPGPQITVVGYTDAAGAAEENARLSRIRAEAVRDYLVAQGIAADRFIVEGRGEITATGSDAVANLERRVEFEVGYGLVAPGGGDAGLRIAIVAPSARDDYAFTESIIDAVQVIADERGNVEVAISDGLFVPEEAEAAIRQYAEAGYDLVIAHGSQYGTSLVSIAPDYPETAFAWGTAADTFGLSNVSAYEVASDQGGYVEGSIAALISDSGTIGVVGPLEVGDAKLFVDGFRNGVLATDPAATVPVTYTGSFSDLTLAAEAAQEQVDAGADVLTGSAQMVVGAVGVAAENDVAWFGTQANQTDLAPGIVVASQVYHWEVVLRQIIAGMEDGDLGGNTYRIDVANGGVVIEYNPAYGLDPSIRSRADDIVAGIIAGTVDTGA